MSGPNRREASERAGRRERIDDAAQDWFLLVTSGEPTRDDRARFSAWYEADPRHRAAFDELCALWADVDGLRDAFAPSAAAAATSRGRAPDATPPAAPDGATASPPRGSRFHVDRRRAVWGTLAAACVAVLLAAAPELATRFVADHRTGVGEQARIALPDGSVAWLNTDTAIEVAYTAEHRRIALLSGEAQFEVEPDADRPFVVTARDGRSTALGTVFAVRIDGTEAAVTVSEGAVAVTSPGDGPDGGHVDAGPNTRTAVARIGEQVRYRRGTPPQPVRRVDPDAVNAWRKGFVAVEGLPLAAALAEIDRYRPGRILLLADTEDLEPVTARLSLAKIDGALDALAATHGLSAVRVTDYLVLVR
jgi:transmembrane sensor